MTKIPTARGDEIDSSELGFTLITECVVGPRTMEVELNWPDHSFTSVPVEQRIAETVKQLEHAKDAGVDTISDRTIPGAGRDVRLLKRIAEQTRINIIVPTGWYTWTDAPHPFMIMDMLPETASTSWPSLADYFVRDVEEGILDTGVRAGTIKITSDHHGLMDGVKLVMRAAAEAHRRTGVPLVTHTGIGLGIRVAKDQQDYLEQLGVDVSRVNFGHVDWTDPSVDLDEFEQVLSKGSFLSFDTAGLDYQWPTDHAAAIRRTRIERITGLIERGYLEQIMISQDDSTYHDLNPMPEREHPTFTTVSRRIIPELKAAGVTDEQITQITVANPRRLLETRDRGRY
ncbi:phosphotriesterase family protein [Nocardia sp. R6R-6]|uniref:phosphotriesterase family protein n=1 Tax=Nocardia sp. R6R-6 TaxID=3459303 RepID=UPI00403D7A3A